MFRCYLIAGENLCLSLTICSCKFFYHNNLIALFLIVPETASTSIFSFFFLTLVSCPRWFNKLLSLLLRLHSHVAPDAVVEGEEGAGLWFGGGYRLTQREKSHEKHTNETGCVSRFDLAHGEIPCLLGKFREEWTS